MATLQKNITLSDEDLDYVLRHLDKIPMTDIARNIGVSYNKLRHNLMVFGVISDKPKQKYFDDSVFQF